MELADSPATVRLEPSWKARLGDYFELPAMRQLSQYLRTRRHDGAIIYPPGPEIFAAFAHTPFAAVKVVILGQDPYHGPGQAHGLSFSVPPGVRPPPSLDNMFKELQRDLGLPKPSHGCLTSWAEQGVLLLNSVLTVEQGAASSHREQGWEGFTDRVVAELNQQRQGLVFMLWGAYAQRKGRLIDRQRHRVLTSVHPSPLSAHRGFIGCGHFSEANHYLEKQGLEPIDWSLPDNPQLRSDPTRR